MNATTPKIARNTSISYLLKCKYTAHVLGRVKWNVIVVVKPLVELILRVGKVQGRLLKTLFDEEHFLVGGKWPEVVGDDFFECVCVLTNGLHGGDDFVAVEASFFDEVVGVEGL